ncbi:MAG: FAD-dependent oxidoreductase, partial [Acidobacteria bacterium]|nr:FAD-dependent oxidoreductase [Acidobacteriota bacterium]
MIARLVSFADLAPDIRHFVFEAPDMASLDFLPGQFASLRQEIGGKTITRAYSLAAAPRGDNQFEICLNRVEGGLFSPHLFALQAGQTVDCHGILGTFGWRDPAMDSILVATGTGIVPFRAMLQHPVARQVTLIHGTRHEAGLLWRAEFEALTGLRYLPTLTRPGDKWAGRRGRVQPLLEDVLGNRTDIQVYVCGLKEMVDSVRALCKACGLDRRQFIA